MKRSLKYVLLLACTLPLLSAQQLHAQVRLLDSLSEKPIAGANIFSKDGALVGLSGNDGHIESKTIDTSSAGPLTIQHVSYENKKIPQHAIGVDTVIYLVPRNVEIGEVQVLDKSKYDYLVIKGYFRKQDFWNNKTRYFYDGILTYYLPLNKKGKLYRKLEHYRLFANQQSVDEFSKMMGWLTEPPNLTGLKEPYSVMQDLPKNGSDKFSGENC